MPYVAVPKSELSKVRSNTLLAGATFASILCIFNRRPNYSRRKDVTMRFPFRLISVLVVSILAGSSAIANGLCPYDDQGPLGCPEGTVWHAKLEVCLSAPELIG